jgi:hypothetical protein
MALHLKEGRCDMNITEPLYVVLFLKAGDDRWEVYSTSEDREIATRHFETAVENSGIDGDFRLIESEIIGSKHK